MNYNFTVPTYWHFACGVHSAFTEYWQLLTWEEIRPSGWVLTVQTAKYSLIDAALVILCAILWTILRFICSKLIFQVGN